MAEESESKRRTFQDILRAEAPRIARELEMKARTASRLAKIQPGRAQELYSLKNAAVRQLFRIPGQMPFVRDAWTTTQGFLLSLKLNRTESWLHFPFGELNVAAQQFYRPWVAKRAKANPWAPMTRALSASGGWTTSRRLGSAR